MKKLLQEKWFKKTLELILLTLLVGIIASFSYWMYHWRFFSYSRVLLVFGLSVFTFGLSFIFTDKKSGINDLEDFLDKTIIYNVPYNKKREKGTIFWNRLNQALSNCFISGQKKPESIVFMYIVSPLIMAEIVINLQKSLWGQSSIAFNQAVLIGWKIFFEFKEIVIIGYLALFLLALANIRLKYKCFRKKKGTFKQTLWFFNWILSYTIIFSGVFFASLYGFLMSSIDNAKDYLPLFFVVIVLTMSILSHYYFTQKYLILKVSAFLFALITLAFLPLSSNIEGEYNYHFIQGEDNKGEFLSDYITKEPEIRIFEENKNLLIYYNHGEQKNKDNNTYHLIDVKDTIDNGTLQSFAVKKALDENKSQAFLFDDNKKLLIYFEELHSISIYDLQSDQPIENMIWNVLSNYSQLTMNERYNKIQFVNASSKEYVDVFYVSNPARDRK